MADSELLAITIQLSPKLKYAFEKMCKEREIKMSSEIRDLMAHSVRSYTRKNGKSGKEDE